MSIRTYGDFCMLRHLLLVVIKILDFVVKWIYINTLNLGHILKYLFGCMVLL